MTKEKEHSPFKDCPFAFICSDRFCMYYQTRFLKKQPFAKNNGKRSCACKKQGRKH
ncbi:MAG: hypothetical protein GY750_04425 [Lentisphaerae bacterium]|nr:hypothetical protein [Lentisphaerota bacterium]MCP4100657.1 hypothetical protein [Lentisphaerota bacterium]